MHIDPTDFNHITGPILNAAIEVHSALGPGLLESVYAPCFHIELAARNLRFEAQKPIPIVYKSLEINSCYRIDLMVEDVVVVEIKSVESVLPVHQAQLLTYMRLTGAPVGLLINFHVPRLMDGVKRLLNTKTGTKAMVAPIRTADTVS